MSPQAWRSLDISAAVQRVLHSRLNVAEVLGELKAVKIGHDGKGRNSAWYLETVIVRDDLNGGEWEFEARCWLDEKMSQDGKRVKVLPGKRSGFSQQSEWNREQSHAKINDWLGSMKLGTQKAKIAQKFEEAEIDPDVLPALDDRHLKQMGLGASARNKITSRISMDYI